jgi:hypothetical protein
LIVTGDSLPRPYTAIIDRTDRYSVPFFVPAGQYTLRVRSAGIPVYQHDFVLGPQRTLEIPLPREIPPTQPAAAEPQ